TPRFLAPEVLDRRGHGVPSDIWALGCAGGRGCSRPCRPPRYALLSGHAPFEARHRPELYRRIRGARYPLPPQLSPRARALLTHMLDPDPAARPGLEDVLGHPFLTQVRARGT
ncbi:PLK2 kinase, partial [Climacteris rufus]|nr:PLK2 kinase [Climacteris rufus]